MKRVLQVVSCLELGGTEAFIMNNYREIDRSQVQFDFLVFVEKEYPYAPEIQRMGGRIFFCGKPQLKRIRNFVKRVQKVIKENGPYDAVHSHANISNSWVLLAAKKAKVPIRVSHSHAICGKGKLFLYTKFKKFLLKRTLTTSLACSEEAGVSLYGSDFFYKKGGVLHNGISLEKFNIGESAALKREFKITENSLVLGNITRFDENKNQVLTVEILAQILKQEPNAVLLLGGPDAGYLEIVKKRVIELGCEDNVRFIGPRTDVPQCLQLIDVYLFPSFSEGLPFALLEAQASGCECFASAGVPKAVDMGLGCVHFLDVKAPVEYWAEQILFHYKNRVRPTQEQIEQAFSSNGYHIKETSQRLLKIYDGK